MVLNTDKSQGCSGKRDALDAGRIFASPYFLVIAVLISCRSIARVGGRGHGLRRTSGYIGHQISPVRNLAINCLVSLIDENKNQIVD